MGWPYPICHVLTMALLVTPGDGDTRSMAESGFWLSSQFRCCCPAEGAGRKALEGRDALLRSDRCCRNSDRRLKTNLTIPHWPQPQLGTAMGVVVVCGIPRSLRWWRRCERLESERRQEVTLNTGAWDIPTRSWNLRWNLFGALLNAEIPGFKTQTSPKRKRTGSVVLSFSPGTKKTGRQRATFCAWSVEPIFSGVLPVLPIG